MDLNIFVKSFSKEEQLELFYLLAGQLHEVDAVQRILQEIQTLENRKKGLIEISDFVENFEMSTRLRNILMGNQDELSPFKFVHEITRKKFYKIWGAHDKTWSELLNIINNKLKIQNSAMRNKNCKVILQSRNVNG